MKPNEKKEFNILIFIDDIKEQNSLEEIQNRIEELKKLDIKKELQDTKQYWKKYVKSHMRHELNGDDIYIEKIRNIYTRTILLYPLLSNQETGGISAAMEIDEEFSKCRKICLLLAKRCSIYY